MKSKTKKKHFRALAAVSAAAIACVPAISFYSLAQTENQPTADDLKSLNSYILGNSDTAPASADMDGDGIIDSFDMVLMRKALADSGVIDDTVDRYIYLEGASIRYEGAGMSLNETADVITISRPGTYIVTGTLDDGQIIVDVDKTEFPAGAVELSLEGAEISCSDNTPVYIASIDDECTITAKKGTDNIISDGTSYTNADEDSGAIYSKDDLKFKGKGNLTVNGNCADGIVGKDDVKVYNGDITVNAVDDGIRGKDSVRIGDPDDLLVEDGFKNLSVTITTTSGDGITATNATAEGKGYVTLNGGTITIDSYADGVQAEQDVTVNGGDITIDTYEGSAFSGNVSTNPWGGSSGGSTTDVSAKGLKSNGTITINGGNINIDSSDDCIHSAGNLSLIGGELNLATADDACHSDADLTIGSGTASTFDDIIIYATKCYEGIEALNITQNSGTVVINSTDDGYNAAGGADGSGTSSPGGWNQGGFGGSSGNYSLNLKGGFGLVNAADGDHDGFDSNGSLTISGGYFITNGNEPFDCDGTKAYSGGVYVINKGAGGMGGPGGMGGGELASTVTSSCSASAGTRITLADGENVIVSFVADKNVTTLTAGCNDNTGAKFYTGGTVTGTPIAELGEQICYISGTITGGTELAAGSSGATTNPWER